MMTPTVNPMAQIMAKGFLLSINFRMLMKDNVIKIKNNVSFFTTVKSCLVFLRQ